MNFPAQADSVIYLYLNDKTNLRWCAIVPTRTRSPIASGLPNAEMVWRAHQAFAWQALVQYSALRIATMTL